MSNETFTRLLAGRPVGPPQVPRGWAPAAEAILEAEEIVVEKPGVTVIGERKLFALRVPRRGRLEAGRLERKKGGGAYPGGRREGILVRTGSGGKGYCRQHGDSTLPESRGFGGGRGRGGDGRAELNMLKTIVF